MVDKTRASTLQERFGFKDSDLKTSEHDEIMCWLDQNIQTLCQRLICFPIDGTWAREEIARCMRQWAEGDHVAVKDFPRIPPCPRRTLKVRSQWEVPIMSGQYTIGFLDMVAQCEFLGLSVSWERTQADRKLDVRQETVGLNFEVKSDIPSIGELIRQINFYRQYRPGHYIIVSADGRWKKQIESQGMTFLDTQNANGPIDRILR
jgi:hypothetical protein